MGNIDHNKDMIKHSMTEHYAYWLHTMIMTATLLSDHFGLYALLALRICFES